MRSFAFLLLPVLALAAYGDSPYNRGNEGPTGPHIAVHVGGGGTSGQVMVTAGPAPSEDDKNKMNKKGMAMTSMGGSRGFGGRGGGGGGGRGGGDPIMGKRSVRKFNRRSGPGIQRRRKLAQE